MSYIVPRDKPKRCTQPKCRFMDRDTLDCRLQDKSWESFEEQYVHCPLIEVPPHGRLIDAVEFGIKYVKVISEETALLREVNAELEKASDRIKQLPSAQPQHIRGHWICDRSWSEGVGMGESYGRYWKCDKCGHLEKSNGGECGCNFCSNCGSDNREVTT